MKKRFSFLAPMAVAVSGLLAVSAPGTAATTDTSLVSVEREQIAEKQTGISAAPFVLTRSAETAIQTATHYSHRSHSSHASHGSHVSHYSSR